MYTYIIRHTYKGPYHSMVCDFGLLEQKGRDKGLDHLQKKEKEKEKKICKYTRMSRQRTGSSATKIKKEKKKKVCMCTHMPRQRTGSPAKTEKENKRK